MMENRRICAICLLAAALSCAAGCSRKGGTGQAENAVADGVLTVGIIDGEDIYARKEGEEFIGIEPRLMGRLADGLAESMGEGAEISIKYIEAEDTDNLLQLLDSKEADIVLGRLADSDSYSQRYVISESYGNGGLYLITKRYNYMDTLAGYPKGVIGISAGVSAGLRIEIPGVDEVTVVDYADISQARDDLLEGVINAAVCTEREAMSLLAGETPGSARIQAQELLQGPREEYVALLAAGQKELAGSLNQAINLYLDELAAGAQDEPAEEIYGFGSQGS